MLRPYITHQILPWNGSTLIKTSKKKGCLIREIICMRHDSPNHWRMLHTDMLATHKNKWNIPTHTFPSSLSGRRFCGSLRSFLSFNTMLSLNSTFIWAYWAYIHKCGPCSLTYLCVSGSQMTVSICLEVLILICFIFHPTHLLFLFFCFCLSSGTEFHLHLFNYALLIPKSPEQHLLSLLVSLKCENYLMKL